MIGYILAGFFFGVIGGMGMGGGLILIPVMIYLFRLDQHTAQGINLIVFLPMAAAALILHFKNRLIDWKKALFLGVSGLAGALIGTNLALVLEEDVLRKSFGILLILLSVYRFFSAVIKAKSARKRR